MEKMDHASAIRKMHSPNIKTRKRALKAIKQFKNQKNK